MMDTEKNVIAEAVVKRCFDARPQLTQKYGPRGREKCLQDTHYHLQYLFEAVATKSPSLFSDYIGWAKVMLAGVKIPAEDLRLNLEALRDALQEVPVTDENTRAADYVARALSALPGMASQLPSFINPEQRHGELARDYLQFLLLGERRQASRIILASVEQGIPVKELYLYVFQPAQQEIGRLWQTNQISVAQEHFCTAATQLIMSQLYPHIFSSAKNGRRMLATCIGSELHEIGVRMVADFFEMEGWDTYYLGANAPASTIIKMVRDKDIELVAISATMTFHVSGVGALIRALRAEPDLQEVRILAGGYPFNIDAGLAERIGADGCAGDAEKAEALARSMLP